MSDGEVSHVSRSLLIYGNTQCSVMFSQAPFSAVVNMKVVTLTDLMTDFYRTTEYTKQL